MSNSTSGRVKHTFAIDKLSRGAYAGASSEIQAVSAMRVQSREMTRRQRQVFEAWCAGEPVADTCERLGISRSRYYQLLRAALRQVAEELRKKQRR